MLNQLKQILKVIFIERRLPYSWSRAIQSILHEGPLKKCLQQSINTPSIQCQPEAATELHLVTCERDTHMAILAIKSLLRFVPNLSVVIHGDESLGERPISIFHQAIPGCRIVTYDEANRLAEKIPDVAIMRRQLPELFKLGSAYERQKKAWALKVLDFHLFSNSDKVIVLDSDTLFTKKPDEIVNWINAESSPSFYAVPSRPNLKVDKNVYKQTFPEAHVINRFNGGLFGFDKRVFPLNKMMEIAETLNATPEIPIFGDECIWRFAYSHMVSKHLSFENYPLFSSKKTYKTLASKRQEMKYMHFLLKHREGLYRKCAKKVIAELHQNK